MNQYIWRVSDVLDDGHNGIITCKNEPDSYGLHADNRIVIGSASLLTKEQAQKICDVHNDEIREYVETRIEKIRQEAMAEQKNTLKNHFDYCHSHLGHKHEVAWLRNELFGKD